MALLGVILSKRERTVLSVRPNSFATLDKGLKTTIQVGASAIVNAKGENYSASLTGATICPSGFSAIKKPRILKLPNADGVTRVTHFVDTVMGREMESE